jgi:predicted ATP-grasp superfamily ATP-dependent carboligase
VASLLRPLSELRPLRDPLFLCAYAGRGGGSAAAAVQYLVDQWAATPVAELDSEEAFDFTVRRPIVRLEGDQRVVEWPKNEFFVASPAGLDRDFILMPGIEPHMRWKAFAEALVECLNALGCKTAIILGSRSGALPHTRPVPFRLVTTDAAFSRLFAVEASFSNYEGPTGITTVISERFGRAGIATASLSAMTPFYVNAEPNPKAVIALVEAVDRAYGTSTSLDLLRDKAAEVDRAAEEAAAQSSELRQAIGSLEQQYDFARGNTTTKPGADATAAELPTGSEAVAQLEEFLRELRGPGSEPATNG